MPRIRTMDHLLIINKQRNIRPDWTTVILSQTYEKQGSSCVFMVDSDGHFGHVEHFVEGPQSGPDWSEIDHFIKNSGEE